MIGLRSLVAVAGWILLMQGMPALAEEDTLPWLDNYKEALQEARRTGLPIFLEYRCEP